MRPTSGSLHLWMRMPLGAIEPPAKSSLSRERTQIRCLSRLTPSLAYSADSLRLQAWRSDLRICRRILEKLLQDI